MKKDELHDILMSLGFLFNHANVYLVLLELREAPASVIAKRLKADRGNILYICKNMKQQGLVTMRKKEGTGFFRAVEPEKLVQLMEDRRRQADEHLLTTRRILRPLKQLADPYKLHPHIRFFEGIEGMKAIREDILQDGHDLYCWTDYEKLEALFGQSYLNDFIQRRHEANIQLFAIKPQTKISAENKMTDTRSRTIKLVPDFHLNGEILIYGKKVVLVNFENDQPMAFQFSGGISRLVKFVFDQFWMLIPAESDQDQS